MRLSRITIRTLAVLLIAAMLSGNGRAVFAQAEETPLNIIITRLNEQGFEIISVNRTWLGRTRVVAESDDYRREVVFNRATGEVMRDLWLEQNTGSDSFDSSSQSSRPSGPPGPDRESSGPPPSGSPPDRSGPPPSGSGPPDGGSPPSRPDRSDANPPTSRPDGPPSGRDRSGGPDGGRRP